MIRIWNQILNADLDCIEVCTCHFFEKLIYNITKTITAVKCSTGQNTADGSST